KQEEKLGNGGFNFFFRFFKTFFSPLHPVVKPVGRHIQKAHPSSLAEEAAVGGRRNSNDVVTRVGNEPGFSIVTPLYKRKVGETQD
ncbi:hypothetical protein, partial [Vibrio vulnificus]|uniref:hypothetical protein n=1 Tax=Vibrio vulnificus TaxID=672 RepID=UPI00057C919B